MRIDSLNFNNLQNRSKAFIGKTLQKKGRRPRAPSNPKDTLHFAPQWFSCLSEPNSGKVTNFNPRTREYVVN